MRRSLYSAGRRIGADFKRKEVTTNVVTSLRLPPYMAASSFAEFSVWRRLSFATKRRSFACSSLQYTVRTGALFALELRNPVGILDLIYAFNDWFVKLIKSCQRQGLIRNATPPEDIVTLGVRIALGAAYEWCRTRGAFDLRQTALSEHETLYDVPPEYRRYSKR